VVNRPSREILSAATANPAPAPTKVSRTILSGNSGTRAVTLSRDSSIVYDAATHRFVNNSDSARTSVGSTKSPNGGVEGGKEATTAAVGGSNARPNVTSVPHPTVSRPAVTPPHPPASSYGGSHGNGGATWGRASSGDTGHAVSSGHSSGPSAGGHSGGGGHH
jgi:hypothetical protein